MGNTLLKSNTSATDPGYTEYARASVTKSDGTVYNAVYCSDGKIHIIEVNATRTTVTDRIQITPSGSETPRRVSLAWNALDSSLGVAYQVGTTTNDETTNNRIRYAKVNTSTWAAPTWEDVTGLAGASTAYSNYDMDISDTGLVMIAAYFVDRGFAASMSVWAKATTGGAWVQQAVINFVNGHSSTKAGESVSIVCLAASGGIRDYVVSASAGFAYNGVKIYGGRVTESTGAQQTAMALKSTVMASALPTQSGVNSKQIHGRLFRNGTNTYDFAGMSKDTKTVHFQRATYNAGTWTLVLTELTNYWTEKTWTTMGISYGLGSTAGSFGPTYYVKNNTGTVWTRSFVYESGAFYFIGGNGRAFPGASTQTVMTLSDNSCPFPAVTDQDIVLTVTDSTAGTSNTYDSYSGFPATMPGGNTGILSLVPASGDINVSGTPALSAVIDTDLKYSESPVTIDWQFAADSGFTTSVTTYRSPINSKGVYVDGTDTPGVTVTFSDTLPSVLSKAVWFYRARLVDGWGMVGPWLTGGSFTVGHPPSAVPTSPLSGNILAWNGGVRTFTWDFTDPMAGDTQSAYQVQIINNVGTVVQDSGKVISATKSYTTPALAGANKDIGLTWQVKVWDSTDTPGNFSTPQSFVLTDTPAVTITTPTSGGAITSGTPVYIFSVTTGGSPVRRISGYQIILSQASTIIYTSALIPVDLASGSTINFKQPANYLQNNSAYTVQISAIDSAGITGVSAPIPFTTSWAAPTTPGAVTVDISAYDLEGAGYVLVQWPDTGRQTNFTHWTVYRKDDLIDPVSGSVLVAGTFQPIYQDYDTGSGYAVKDFEAPSNQYQSTYAVTQWINVTGQDQESAMSTATAVKPASSAYWLINENVDNNTADTMRLSIVTDDSYTEEQEESEFTVIGRGRVVNRGQYLGPKGSLTARLRNTGATTARQKRLNLMTIINETGELKLRNPFGDIWSVNASNVGVSRIAGVGAMEFCDVTIPYAEVS